MTRTDALLLTVLGVMLASRVVKWHRYIVSRQAMFAVTQTLLSLPEADPDYDEDGDDDDA